MTTITKVNCISLEPTKAIISPPPKSAPYPRTNNEHICSHFRHFSVLRHIGQSLDIFETLALLKDRSDNFLVKIGIFLNCQDAILIGIKIIKILFAWTVDSHQVTKMVFAA